MAFSRHSLRRVIGDMVHRHNGKNDTINQHCKTQERSGKKADRNSIISNGSLSVSYRELSVGFFLKSIEFSYLRHRLNDYIKVKKKFVNH